MNAPHDWKRNDRVTIATGPYAGRTGTVTRVMRGQRAGWLHIALDGASGVASVNARVSEVTGLDSVRRPA